MEIDVNNAIGGDWCGDGDEDGAQAVEEMGVARVIVALVLLRRLSAVAASIVARVSRHVGFDRRTGAMREESALERGEVHSRDRWR